MCEGQKTVLTSLETIASAVPVRAWQLLSNCFMPAVAAWQLFISEYADTGAVMRVCCPVLC